MSLKSARRDEEEDSGPDSEDHASLENVFRDKEGNPMCFFLHKSISLVWQRQNLTNEIQLNGGIVRPNDSDVDTVLVGQDYNKENLQVAYRCHSDLSKRRTWVEPMSFVARCLREGVVRHCQEGSCTVSRSSSSGYTRSFTHDDDEKLARYLAIRLPDKKRGRGGNSVYMDLYRAYGEDREEFRWVARHPWLSWRARYQRNAIRFDDMIDKYVNLEKTEQRQAYRPKRKTSLDEFTEDEQRPGNSPKRRRVDLFQDSLENRGKIRPSLAQKGKDRMISEDASDTSCELSPSSYDDIPVMNFENPEQRQAYRPKRKSSLDEFIEDGQRPGNSPKRRRVDLFQDSLENRGKIRPSLAQKGKDRMISEDASDTSCELSPSSYDDIPVPGPSKRTPHRSRKRLDLSPPYDLSRSRKMTVPDLSSHARRHNKVTWGETGVEVQQDISPLTRESHALVTPMSSAQISGIGLSTKTFSTLLQHMRLARKTAQRDKPVIVSSVPSYPNTGSRSRSVEPSILPSRLKTRQVGAAVGPSRISLPLLDESVNENDQSLMEVCSPELIGERLEEERSVEDLLFNDISERLQATEGESQIHMKDNPLIQNTANAPTSLYSDDAQIDKWLRQRARIRMPLEEPDVSPDEILRRFREASGDGFYFPRTPSVQEYTCQVDGPPIVRQQTS
ncbi:hypothetical protein C0992_010923 [Termitomyces sp. T32_za158]|nr:hypothetical protein C0992_010923 [Termitomyces sp. T32_za158]